MIYDNIKAICKEKNISISKMEKDLGFPQGSIHKWNINIPSVIKVKKVTDYLNVNIGDLI